MPPLDKRVKKFLQNSIRVAPKISSKGELSELRNGLVSPYPQTRKDAIRSTIQQMTLGKDVSSLFADVLKNMATNDVEQKKLVYLYVMNYAETHPELCILAVNTFVTDAQDPNPLIRCMAIRTMSMIKVDKILEYVEIPLRKTLQDENAYVRKTAVICVAKLFHLNPELCKNLGVLQDLQEALDHENPMVIANAVAALVEINNLDPSVIDLKKLIQSHVKQFLAVLNECTEWARIIILNSLAEYSATDAFESKDIIDRVTAHLQHVNPAVVFATIKVILSNLPLSTTSSEHSQTEGNSSIMKKLSAALVSLMSTPPEMQYVALKNIRIILEKYPGLLSRDLRIFYIKFNDPLYLKVEKIDTLVRLVDPKNPKQCTLLLTELSEYAREFEPEFVIRSIQGLVQLAIKQKGELLLQKVVDTLIEIIDAQDMFRDECCVGLCNILRHSPTNGKLIDQVCSLFNSWSSPDAILHTDKAKCNYIWILGQYPHKFPTLHEKIRCFLENFKDEELLTQTSYLVTVVRLHSILEGSLLQTVFELATEQSNELDVREMAMIYWRCLSLPESERLVTELCQSQLPNLDNALDTFTPEILEKLLKQLGTIGSIYFKPCERRGTRPRISSKGSISNKPLDELTHLAHNELAQRQNNDVLLDFSMDDNSDTEEPAKAVRGSTLVELDDLFSSPPTVNSESTAKVTEGVQNMDINSLLDI